MPSKNFIEELRWRGMLNNLTAGAEEQLQKEATTGYIGFDPTSDSLHVGSLVQIMILTHFQQCGHRPIAVVGGATGMVGDPSGKTEERKLQSLDQIRLNEKGIKAQLEKFLDFSKGQGEIVNNADWFGPLSAIDFLREAGKYLTANYLLDKDYIKDRKEGISFTEFSYVLMQAYDFSWLYEYKNCKLQMGGSDQWGNITAGTELIRKKLGGEAFGVTCNLLLKADGGKFGKTESGNVWLDPKKTSPYRFYQFWLNSSDEDAKKQIKIFTLKSREEIDALIAQHDQAPERRLLQQELAKDVTIRVHSEADYQAAVEASEILFGKGTTESLRKLSEEDFLAIFEGVPQFEVSRNSLETGVSILDLTAVESQIFSSKGEARKLLQGGGLSLNKEKVSDTDRIVNTADLINNRYILVQKGKKNYYLIKA